MSYSDLIQHRQWVWNRLNSINGPHWVGFDTDNHLPGTHAFPGEPMSTDVIALCGNKDARSFYFERTTEAFEWPTCPLCAAMIYELCPTSPPELVSVQSEHPPVPEQLVLPGLENFP